MTSTRSRPSTVREIRSLGMFGRAWAIGIVAFSAARALIAWPTLGEYGVNPWWFLLIDIVTAPPYGVAQAITVKILRDPSRTAGDALPWATLVGAMFFAPYVFIVVASNLADTPQPMPAHRVHRADRLDRRVRRARPAADAPSGQGSGTRPLSRPIGPSDVESPHRRRRRFSPDS